MGRRIYIVMSFRDHECCNAEMTYRWVDQVLVFIDRIFSRPESHTLDDGQNTSLLSWRCPALKLLCLHQLAFYAEDGLLHAAGLDLLAVCRRQPGQGPFTDTVRRVHTRSVGRFQIMLADDVDRAFSRIHQVPQTILRSVKATSIPDDEDRGIVINNLSVRERSEVGRAPIFASGTDESDWTWNNGADEKLVVERRWSSILVRVNGDVLLLQALAAVVGAVSGFPVGVRSLRHVPFGTVIELWT